MLTDSQIKIIQEKVKEIYPNATFTPDVSSGVKIDLQQGTRRIINDYQEFAKWWVPPLSDPN
jgi:hypothetical protein